MGKGFLVKGFLVETLPVGRGWTVLYIARPLLKIVLPLLIVASLPVLKIGCPIFVYSWEILAWVEDVVLCGVMLHATPYLTLIHKSNTLHLFYVRDTSTRVFLRRYT